jgi:tRNA(Ile)-lysidine synthase
MSDFPDRTDSLMKEANQVRTRRFWAASVITGASEAIVREAEGNRVGRVTDEVKRFARTRGVCGTGVVAVSGGADSVALVRALHECGIGPLVVTHLNHKLRGEESDADEQFVLELARGLGVPFAATTIDVASLAQGENLEAVARRVRYDFFDEVAGRFRAAWIATGHTADDQAETVLHRMIRGTGLQGLRGIAQSKSSTIGPRILRPLLTVSRAEVLEYLTLLNQSFCTDSSNADSRFTRNRIRAKLLPLLKTFNPDVVSVLARLAEQSQEAFEILLQDAAELLTDAELSRAGEICVLDVKKLTAAHPYHVREALRLLWRREGWPVDRMTFDHWNRLVSVARGDLSSADFPGGVTVTNTGRVVQIEKAHPSQRVGL